MAETGRRVVLVDGDLRQPSIAEHMGLRYQRGLSRLIADRAPVDEALKDWDDGAVRVLPGGPVPPNPDDLLAAPAMAWMAWMIWKAGFEPLALHRWEVWQQIGRPLIGLAHASVLLLIVRAGAAQALVNRLAAAGRMAFSNYLMTSIITTVVFCGFGFGLYGKLSRFELLYVVAGVWGFIVVWSLPWLTRFHYGPFEWAWRSLVRWRPQPFVKSGAEPAAAAA